ncbi:NfeD family protein [Aquamicrobium sp. LC103]|uniref:NfeD family protein n=1 Tax=Aquamicrobium sp. LC103 TaxID=1120658 RepID=UPI00063EC198|nr:NfeD family protein [Aquamicrobium sp. LC103]TKT77538.1 NfeD family protein [Aquamicrobium sp. LC103]
MIANLIAELGPWNWMVLGFVLLALEILAPGVFLLWIGIAAVLTGTLSLQLWDAGFWTWQVQVLVFLALSLVSVVVGKRLIGNSRNENSDEPLLNRRGQQLIGRTATLEEAIRDGHGRIRVGDTLWRVTGPDLPTGARVRVVEAKGGDLTVEPL